MDTLKMSDEDYFDVDGLAVKLSGVFDKGILQSLSLDLAKTLVLEYEKKVSAYIASKGYQYSLFGDCEEEAESKRTKLYISSRELVLLYDIIGYLLECLDVGDIASIVNVLRPGDRPLSPTKVLGFFDGSEL